MPDSTPVVFVVDDDVSVRESLEPMIRFAGWRPELFASAQDFLLRPAIALPRCLVLDVEMPGISGLDLQERIAADPNEMPIIFLTGHGDIPKTVRAMKAGAADFLTKPASPTLMVQAIGRAIERSRMACRAAAEVGALRRRHAALTCREQQVMALVVEGLLNKEVAARLDITEITVKGHRGKVMEKMNAACFADLVRMADRLKGSSSSQFGSGDHRASPSVGGATILTEAKWDFR
jgi:FixJ family two-component response regulator